MKMEELGTNTFYWLKKCKGAQVCVELPYYNGYTIGACSIKVRSHYDGESCANGNKCTSGVCDGTKCKGKAQDQRCEPGLGQCKKGLLCRLKDTNAAYTSCQPPIDNDKECTGLYPKEDPTDPSSDTLDSEYPLVPAYNPCKLGYVCSVNDNADGKKYCVKIGNLDNGKSVTNQLACKSGLEQGDECVAKLSYTKTTSLGAEYEIGENTTKAFNEWLSEVGDNNMKDEDAIYEAYRYTRNKKKVNKAWFIYTENAFVRDADECAFDYKWKQSSSNYIQFSLIILIFTLLF
jgi:hypothetical protein